MSVAAGGLIKYGIVPDNNPAITWDIDRSIGFNVQILNSDLFHRVAGVNTPNTPVSAAP